MDNHEKKKTRTQIPSVQGMTVQDERRALSEIRKQFQMNGKVSPHFILETTGKEAGDFALKFCMGQHMKRKNKSNQTKKLIFNPLTGQE